LRTDNTLYTIHEKSSTLTAQAIPSASNGTSDIIANISAVPMDAPTGSLFAAAEVLIPPASAAFPVSNIYTSNRNLANNDPRGDSITIFSALPNIKLVKQVFTGLNQVRGMQFSPDGDYLVAAGVAGKGGVAIFQRINGGTDLKEVARNTDIATRSSFVWLPLQEVNDDATAALSKLAGLPGVKRDPVDSGLLLVSSGHHFPQPILVILCLCILSFITSV
jgi:6-phosphogluconolactonase (cycloisomerase 2 family)